MSVRDPVWFSGCSVMLPATSGDRSNPQGLHSLCTWGPWWLGRPTRWLLRREPHTALWSLLPVVQEAGRAALYFSPFLLCCCCCWAWSWVYTWHFGRAPPWCGAADGQSGSPFSCSSPHTQDTGRGAHLRASESGARGTHALPALRDTSRASAS